MLRYCLILIAAALYSVPTMAAPRDEGAGPLSIGAETPQVELADFRGKSWQWEDVRGEKLTVIAFVGVECPLVKLYSQRLEEMHQTYASKGVAFVGVNSNQQDSLTEIAHFVRTNKLTFPMLKDAGNRLADGFRAKRTPEVFIVDAKRRLRYRGRIDDQYTYGIQKPKVTRAHLREALDELLAGRKVSVAETETVGCHIGRLLTPKPNSEITYSNQVSRILQKRCVSCHRSGEIAPFALTDYEEVVGWAEMIAEVVDEQRMPPWHANPDHGKFSNDASLSATEKQTILDWVDAGAPQGDPKQLPTPKKFEDGWRIGTPDLIIKMADQPFHVPAEGEVKYQHFVVDPGFKEDKWVKAAECRPGNREVVHHIIVGFRRGRKKGQNIHGVPDSEWIAATAPGAAPLVLEPGRAKRIPAGAKLFFQMHYTPTGVAQDDLSSVGLVFADPKEVKQEVSTQQASNSRFRIPPGADNHKVEAKYRFNRDTLLLSLFPHMHLRGKAFRYTLLEKDPENPERIREVVLLDVPNYDFNWQNSYDLAEPRFVAAGSTLVCTAHFDNSEDNLSNPDPTETVRWGDQTWEEMMIGYFNICLADQDLTKPGASLRRTDKFLAKIEKEPFDAAPFARGLEDALATQTSLRKFGGRLQKAIPQLDRMDWSYIDGDRLRIGRVVQSTGPAAIGQPLTLPARGLALADYVRKEKTVVNQSLGGIRQHDMQAMSKFFRSSIHIPHKRAGKAGLISFWSDEADAFPPKVVSALESIVSGASN